MGVNGVPALETDPRSIPDDEELKLDPVSHLSGKSNNVGREKQIASKYASSKRLLIRSCKSVSPSEEKKARENNFVQIDADSNELSNKQKAGRSSRENNRIESDRISFSRAVSLYRASNNNSIESSMKGTRWSFGHKLEPGAGTRFIFMPLESIKIKYRVLEMIQATAYGDIFRIQIQ